MSGVEVVARAECFGNREFAGYVATVQESYEVEPEWRDAVAADPEWARRHLGVTCYRWPAASAEEVGTGLGAVLGEVVAALGVGELTAVLEGQCPWLAQKNPYPPVRRARRRIKRWAGGDKGFNGGLRAGPDGLPELVEAVFWLGRCCAGLPYAHFVPTGRSWYLSVCKHGDLHVEHFDARERQAFDDAARAAGLVEVERSSYPDFGAVVPGRRIIV